MEWNRETCDAIGIIALRRLCLWSILQFQDLRFQNTMVSRCPRPLLQEYLVQGAYAFVLSLRYALSAFLRARVRPYRDPYGSMPQSSTTLPFRVPRQP